MNKEKFEPNEKINGWKDETVDRANTIALFIKKYSEDEKLESETTHRHYGSDFSTAGGGLTSAEWQGEVKPDEVKVYFEGGEIKKIHIHYPTQNTDVYLDGKALEDLLRE